MFYNEGCIPGARNHLKSGSVDLIVTDPPFGINGDSFDRHYNRDDSLVLAGYVDVPKEEYEKFSQDWILEAERVLRPGGSIYIVSGYTNLYHILGALRATNLVEVNHLIWKFNFGVFTLNKYVSSHYHILYYVKPGRKPTFNTETRFSIDDKVGGKNRNYADREDVWMINKENHPGEVKTRNRLPSKLLRKMIGYSSVHDDLVCDFFLGSFSTARVAIDMGRRATGFEISKGIFDAGIKGF